MIAAFAVVAVVGILLRPLIPIDETRYVDVAWEMWLSGDYFVPHKNFEIYTDKPPLLFWLINLVWAVTGGVSGFGARIVGPLFALATLAGTWALGRRLWDGRTGALAAIILAGTSVFAIYGGTTMFDTMLAAATLAGLLVLHSALSRPGVARRQWALFGLCLAFGVLAKGPVILFHLGPTLIAWKLWTDPESRPTGREFARGLGRALLVCLAVVALWVVPAASVGGAEYREMILWKQTSGRVVTSFAHARPGFWLLALMPVVLFPWVWSPSLWAGMRRLSLSDRALRLCLVWGLGGLALFSLISGKQVHYLVPEFPAFALIFARALLGAPEQKGGLMNMPAAVLAVLLGVLAVVAGFGLTGDAVIEAQLRPIWAPLVFLVLMLGLAAAAYLLPRIAGLAVLGLGTVLGLNLLIGMSGLSAAYDSAPIAARLVPHAEAGLAVVANRYNAEFGFEGRMTTHVDELTAEEAEGWLAAHPGGMLAAPCKRVETARPPAEVIHFYGDDWCLWEGGAAQ